MAASLVSGKCPLLCARTGQLLKRVSPGYKYCCTQIQTWQLLQQHARRMLYTRTAAGSYSNPGSEGHGDKHSGSSSSEQQNGGSSRSAGPPTNAGGTTAGTWLGRSALVAAVVPILVWSVTWVLDTGLMHCGYTCLWAMTQLGAALYHTSQGGGATADYTDLALRTAARLAVGGDAAARLADEIPGPIQFALVASLHCWRAVQHSVMSIKLGLPWLSIVQGLCVLCCGITFAVTLTPLRPVIAAVVTRLQQQPTQAGVSAPHSSTAGHSSAHVAAAVEDSMQAVGRLALVVLMTTVQATEVTPPPLSAETPMLAAIPAGDALPSLASSLFALAAPLSDILLPALLASLAATAAWHALTSWAHGAQPAGVHNRAAADGKRLKQGTWTKVSIAACALRAALDAVWLVTSACGLMPGSVSVVRVVGGLMLARLTWRGLREVNE